MPRKTKTHPTMEEIYDRDIYEKEETVTEKVEVKQETENVIVETVTITPNPVSEEKETEPEYLTVYFEIQTIHPDSREFRQQSIELTPYMSEECAGLLVGVNVPNIPLYVLNKGDNGIVVFTPAGWFYVQQELEKPYLSLVDQSKKPVNETATEDDWDETPSTNSATKKSSDDDWGDDDTSTSSTKSDKGNEKVNVDEEDW